MKRFPWFTTGAIALILILWAVGVVPANVRTIDNQAVDSVTLAWDANTEPDLAGYRVYQGSKSGGPYTKIADVPVMPMPEYTITGLADGTWFWVVTAYDTGGLESGYSNEVSKTVNRPPAAPKNLIIKILQAIAWLIRHTVLRL